MVHWNSDMQSWFGVMKKSGMTALLMVNVETRFEQDA
jgi:hypothetical protein